MNNSRQISYVTILAIFSSFLFLSFVGWLYHKTDDDIVYEILVEYDRLNLIGELELADELVRKSLAEQKGDSLDLVWLVLVRTQAKANAYANLNYYVKFMRAAPSQEFLYREVSAIMKLAPPSYRREIKPVLVNDLRKISGINLEYLSKYELSD